MRVERTASTKLPSARESRASVACQYRAAACAEIFCANLVCVWLMFNTLKGAQAERQIYPKRFGKVRKAGPAKKPADQASPGVGAEASHCTALPSHPAAPHITAPTTTHPPQHHTT